MGLIQEHDDFDKAFDDYGKQISETMDEIMAPTPGDEIVKLLAVHAALALHAITVEVMLGEAGVRTEELYYAKIRGQWTALKVIDDEQRAEGNDDAEHSQANDAK